MPVLVIDSLELSTSTIYMVSMVFGSVDKVGRGPEVINKSRPLFLDALV